MSETLRIELDRADRTYRSGEPIRGRILIDTDHGALCRSVHLSHYWRTHGRGNPDRSDRRAGVLHEGPLPGEPPHAIGFEIVAPGGPFTYHGSLLHVDHYLEAWADIPGFLDDGTPEKFILLPGTAVDAPPPELFRVTGSRAKSAGGCRVVLGALLLLFGFLILPMGLILIIPGLFLLFPALRRGLAGARLGEVTSRLDTPVVEPGETVRVQAVIKSPKARDINAASAVLRGREICISGSQKDRRVHMHEIHRQEVALSGARSIPAGRDVTLTAELSVPEGDSWTFSSKDNEVTWDVTVHVDIPAWPDWEEEHKLVVWASRPALAGVTTDEEEGRKAGGEPSSGSSRGRPGETAQRLGEPSERPGARAERSGESAVSRPPLPEPPASRPQTPERAARQPPPEPPVPQPPLPEAPVPEPPLPEAPASEPPASEPPASEPPESEPTPAPAPSPPPVPVAGRPELAVRVREILAEKSFGGGRRPLIDALVGERFTFDLAVDSLQHTFGAGPDPTYRHGRTVKGTIAGTDVAIEVRFPAARNEELDRSRPSSIPGVTGTVVDWEKLSETPVLEA